jgi:hypothetical protein
VFYVYTDEPCTKPTFTVTSSESFGYMTTITIDGDCSTTCPEFILLEIEPPVPEWEMDFASEPKIPRGVNLDRRPAIWAMRPRHGLQ